MLTYRATAGDNPKTRRSKPSRVYRITRYITPAARIPSGHAIGTVTPSSVKFGQLPPVESVFGAGYVMPGEVSRQNDLLLNRRKVISRPAI